LTQIRTLAENLIATLGIIKRFRILRSGKFMSCSLTGRYKYIGGTCCPSLHSENGTFDTYPPYSTVHIPEDYNIVFTTMGTSYLT
jgi:hypothetical protein